LSNTEPAPAEETPAMRRVVARTALRNARERFAGQLHWVETPDGVLFNGVGLAPAARAALARTVRTPAGWLISNDPMFLHRFFDALGADGRDALVRRDELFALAGERPAILTPVKQPKITTVTHTIGGARATFTWTQPFSEEGKSLRERLKQFGARYNGDKGWDLPVEQVQRAAYGALLVDGVFLSPELHELASDLDAIARLAVEDRLDALQSGRTVYDIVKHDGEAVWVGSSGKRDDAYAVFSGNNLRWDRDLFAYRVPHDKFPATIAMLAQLPDVELADLVHIAHAHATRLAVEESVRLEGQPVVPELSPAGTLPLPKQREMVEFMLDRRLPRGKIQACDVGTGKTLATSWAAHLLTEHTPADRIVIVCPAHLKDNWRDEIFKHIGTREFVQVIEGRDGHISKNYRWTILNYELVAAHVARLRELAPRLVLLDEGDRIRNDTTWSQAMFGQREEPGSGWLHSVPEVWPISGSEIRNRPRELFNLLQAIKHPLGENFFRFGVRYCAGHQINAGRRVVWDFNGYSNLAELGRVVAPFYQRLELDEIWADAPPKTIVPVPVALTDAERRGYVIARSQALLAYKRSSTAERITAITAERVAAATIKAPYAIARAELALERGEAVGIFSSFALVLDRVEKHFGSACVRIDGSMAPPEKYATAMRFQHDPAIRVFAGQTVASGSGFTLTKGNRSILVDYPWTPDDMAQAEGRFRRLTQTRLVEAERLHAPGTSDDFMAPMLDGKKRTIDAFRRAARGEDVDEADLAPPPSQGSIAAQLALFLEQREKEESQDRRRVTAAVPPDASATVAHVPTVSA
jgi:hypothetical protein